MLTKVNRKTVFDGLQKILKVGSWTSQQVEGLDRLLDGFERDHLIPDGLVGQQRAAYYIFSDWIETGHTFTPIKERGGPRYFVARYGANTRKGRELGNDTDEEAVLYAGAGDVQLTGEDNYEAAEEMLRTHYPELVAEWEAMTGKTFDLTVGDQPDDSDDVKNALYPPFSYAIMVGGTTLGLFGPPINRYINAKVCKFGEARRSVNGTDRAGEFVYNCPRILKVLQAAAMWSPEEAGTATPETQTEQTPATTTIENAGAVNVAASTQTEALKATEGGAVTDGTAKVTNGSGSWIRTVLTWMGGVVASASGYGERIMGLPEGVLRPVVYALMAFGGIYMVLKFAAEWQIRAIAADPNKQNVK